ncbi:MAG: 4-hydroxybenzoate octaprenyltransferase [Pseudomonadales bacterium]|nr:4-hydroxybenzoate octaprenyltransferase [Pseudomonadales bacterium]
MTHALTQYLQDINRRYPRLKHFVALTRLDRPIGTYLLLWPTLCALWIAAEGWPGWHLFMVFTLGTLLTRSAGCIVNDLADIRFDGRVKRTRDRPLVTGRVDPMEAVGLACTILFICLLLVLTTNWYTVMLSVLAVVIATIYPLMKRYTYLPQAVLGIAFSMGIPMAFTAVNNEISNVAWLLLIANLLWVVAYDTEYAMVDRDDDVRLGIKSTAILFADLDRPMIAILQVSTLVTLMLIPRQIDMSYWYYLGLCLAAALFIYQHYLIRNRSRDGCFEAFLNNHWVGLSLFIGIVLHFSLA